MNEPQSSPDKFKMIADLVRQKRVAVTDGASPMMTTAQNMERIETGNICLTQEEPGGDVFNDNPNQGQGEDLWKSSSTMDARK
ncbi:MAG: hypothetical protein ED859_03780 [Desulfuromonadales bacterium]|nr:MAG: hypothetical protein ED859_03780 [Desulfuromonadales bacterium]